GIGLTRSRARRHGRPMRPSLPPGRPISIGLVGLVAAAAVYVLVYPFTRVHYPPMTDLPFLASSVSIVRHYFDPAFHFNEQFLIDLRSTPYWTLYLVG